MSDQRDDDLAEARLALCQAAAVLARLDAEGRAGLDAADLARAEAHASDALRRIRSLGLRELL